METSQLEKSLREMYELGYKHGKENASIDNKIEQLRKELKELKEKNSGKS